MHESHTISEERFEFTSGARNKILIVGAIGVLLLVIGILMAGNGGGEEPGGGHGAASSSPTGLVASLEPVQAEAESGTEGGHEEGGGLFKRIITSLWHNNIFFAGIGIIGLFFIAIQYAAQAGWSAQVKRIPLAISHWILFSGIIMLAIYFAGSHDLFHWTHKYLYAEEGGDKILKGKAPYFFWPLAGGEFPVFFIVRMVLFFGLWYLFFIWIKREMLAEDLDGDVKHWYSARVLSTVFIIIFAVSSSIGAWDWVMSIDPHWFSTMMGWYVFASWWVTGLSVIALILIYLQDAGYLKEVVNANHLHNLGMFIFGFSIFWTYIWFSQFMLIWYAHIPEETVYFVLRKTVSPYSWIFYANLVLNFGLPFLLLMPRDSKRFASMMRVACFIVVIGHWLDFYLMVTPGIMKYNGSLGLIEIGLGLIFLAAFLFVVLTSLAKFPLVAKHHPMTAESLNHHI